ncbi:unnamed protein product [Darwinula stevensoni]|uniref:Peptidase S1 domain-containing protein n=1 Tax=Darwinula stevensoni TaxID=69355 RepID=A0A7R9ABL7_9CRUS|nr:unnamed protein product [Darwinula stevensoni]CAG0899004.1 unnamed protein product [Darwinula stevensoni]
MKRPIGYKNAAEGISYVLSSTWKVQSKSPHETATMFRLIVASLLVVSSFGRVVRKPMLDGRIVGGDDAMEGEIPWQVSLESFGSHICGGFILDEMNVITAAHCCDAVSSFTVVAGEHDRSETSGNEVEIDVERMVPHEDYNGFDLTADICLLHLESALEWSEFIYPAEMPAQFQDWDDGDMMTVSGWGSTSEGGSLPDILQKVDVAVVSDADCDDYYSSFGGIDFDAHICAGNMPEGGADSCQGDSGGPMFETGGGIVSGIVSWGVGCARPEFPGVYSQLATYMDWVEENRQRF